MPRQANGAASCATSSIPISSASDGDGKWFVTVAYRLDHVDIFHADGFKLAGRVFIDGLPSHMAFDAGSKTVFIALQQSGRLAAFDLATQTVKWKFPSATRRPASSCCPRQAYPGRADRRGRRRRRRSQGWQRPVACRPARARTVSGPRAMAVTGS